jgi:hypothetical protein
VLDLAFVCSMMTVRCHFGCAALELDAVWLTEFVRVRVSHFAQCKISAEQPLV